MDVMARPDSLSNEPLRVVVGPLGVHLGARRGVSLDKIVALLETVGGHLEGRNGGSRFPLLWRFAPALMKDGDYGWYCEELGDLVQELDTIEREGESLPASVAPMFAFGDEGYPDVYSRESPRALGTVRSAFQPLLDHLRAFASEAQDMGKDLLIQREGAAIDWWKN
jgi:hypothetical protein